EKVRMLDLLRQVGSDRIIYSCERMVSIKVDGVPVTHGVKEPCFGTVGFYLGSQGSGDTSGVKNPFFGLSQEFIAQGYLIHDPAVHGPDELIPRSPVLGV